MVIKWEGSGIDEVGVDEKTGRTLIKIDKNYYRPTEVKMLQGDFSKAEKLLNWKPKRNLEEMCSNGWLWSKGISNKSNLSDWVVPGPNLTLFTPIYKIIIFYALIFIYYLIIGSNNF